MYNKYKLLLSDYPASSKAGRTIKEYIENADHFLENFKGTRDSEFSDYGEMDLEQLRRTRMAEIKEIRDKYKNVEIYQVRKNRRRNQKGYSGSSKEMDDIYENNTDDEEKLISHFKKQRQRKADQLEEERHR